MIRQIGVGVGDDIARKLLPLGIVDDKSKQAMLVNCGTCSTVGSDGCTIEQPKLLARLIHESHRERDHDDRKLNPTVDAAGLNAAPNVKRMNVFHECWI